MEKEGLVSAGYVGEWPISIRHHGSSAQQRHGQQLSIPTLPRARRTMQRAITRDPSRPRWTLRSRRLQGSMSCSRHHIAPPHLVAGVHERRVSLVVPLFDGRSDSSQETDHFHVAILSGQRQRTKRPVIARLPRRNAPRGRSYSFRVGPPSHCF